MSKFGVQSMTAPLRSVAVRRPPASLATADTALWNYSAPVDLEKARDNHAALVSLLRSAGVEVLVMGDEPDELPDSVFTYDASLVTRAGVVLMRMGKRLRGSEPDLHEAFYRGLGIPILGRVEPPGVMEAGDALWINDRTVVLGRGFRTNDEGARQLAQLLTPLGVEIIPVDLPYGSGPQSCMHLLSLVNLLADDLALVHLPAAPVRLVLLLEKYGVRIISAPIAEYLSSNTVSANVLACAPRKLIMVEGCPETKLVLEDHGCSVSTFAGDELCLKAEGGPVCLTRPILRI